MRSQAVLEELRSRADPSARAGMARFGIRGANVLGGSSMPMLRAMAKRIGIDHRMALELWESDVHEARLLATMVEDPGLVTEAQMERWVHDCDSWDLVDGACSNLFRLTPYAWAKALAWSRMDEEFVKRAGFAMMAVLAVHDHGASDARFLQLLPVIEREAGDPRNFVRKAVNWALRQIGKRNATLNRAAVAACQRILAAGRGPARWVATDALRELTSDPVQRRIVRR